MIPSIVDPQEISPDRIGKLMGFSDLMMHLDSLFNRVRKVPAISGQMVRPFSESHVFYLGEEGKISDAISGIWPDLAAEMRARILMPFKDVTIVVKVEAERTKLVPYDCWVVNRFVESPELGREGQPFRVFTYSVRHAGLTAMPELYSYWYLGLESEEEYSCQISSLFRVNLWSQKVTVVTEKQAIGESTENAASMLRAIALISHPANYVVKVTPELTPREARRACEGRPTPEKKPHFIVVDHDVLGGLRRGEASADAHSSPVPHHRRGHWRRLAERCTRARLLHGDRIPVRPTLVGESSFKVGKNLYDVQLDFGLEAGAE